MKFQAVVAAADSGAIGVDGKIPWSHPADLQQFRRITGFTPCVMGRKTYESICESFTPEEIQNGGPLSDMERWQIVLTRNEEYDTGADYGVKVVHSYDEAIDILNTYQNTRPYKRTDFSTVSIIGGEEIYDLFYEGLDEIWYTRVRGKVEDSDAHFYSIPELIDDGWEKAEYPLSEPYSNEDWAKRDFFYYRFVRR